MFAKRIHENIPNIKKFKNNKINKIILIKNKKNCGKHD
jgi:hypothetical protein